MKLPQGFEGQVRPRSGLALKKGITVLNTPGTCDEQYLGPIGVVIINHSSDPFVIKRGDRIAQLVIQRIPEIDIVEIGEDDEFEETARGAGGFGSTGIGS